MTAAKERKKTQILDQGVALLMTHGYHGTGLKLILDTVQVPKGSFYSYFESKENFTAEAISHYIAPFLERLQHFLKQPDLNGHEAIKAYFDSLMADLAASDFKGGCLLGDMMGEIGSSSDACRQALLSAIRRYCHLLEQGLEDAQTQGVVRDDIPASVLARLLFDGWQGALLEMKVERSIAPLQRCSARLLDQFFLSH